MSTRAHLITAARAYTRAVAAGQDPVSTLAPMDLHHAARLCLRLPGLRCQGTAEAPLAEGETLTPPGDVAARLWAALATLDAGADAEACAQSAHGEAVCDAIQSRRTPAALHALHPSTAPVAQAA